MFIQTIFYKVYDFIKFSFRNIIPIFLGNWLNFPAKTIIVILRRPIVCSSFIFNLATCKPIIELVTAILRINNYFDHNFYPLLPMIPNCCRFPLWTKVWTKVELYNSDNSMLIFAYLFQLAYQNPLVLQLRRDSTLKFTFSFTSSIALSLISGAIHFHLIIYILQQLYLLHKNILKLIRQD